MPRLKLSKPACISWNILPTPPSALAEELVEQLLLLSGIWDIGPPNMPEGPDEIGTEAMSWTTPDEDEDVPSSSARFWPQRWHFGPLLKLACAHSGQNFAHRCPVSALADELDGRLGDMRTE